MSSGETPQIRHSVELTPAQWRILFGRRPSTPEEVAAFNDVMAQSNQTEHGRQFQAEYQQEPSDMTREQNNRRPSPQYGNRRSVDFAAEIRNAAQSHSFQPGRAAPVLGGQATAHQTELAQARANRRPVDWNSETLWLLNSPLPGEAGCPFVSIDWMSPELLYREIEAVISSVVRVYQIYAEGTWLQADAAPVGLTAKRWLAIQPAFRALLQEALRKNVALSDAAYLYVKQFVLTAGNQTGVVNRPQPWADATRLAQQSDLKEFVNHAVRVVTEESVVDEFGRSGRALRLDDD